MNPRRSFPGGSAGALQYSGGSVFVGAGWTLTGPAGSERLLGPGATDDNATPLQVNGNARFGNSGGAVFTLTIADGQISKQPGQRMEFGAVDFANATSSGYFEAPGMIVGLNGTSGYLTTDAAGKVIIIGDTATGRSGGIIDVALPVWTRMADAGTNAVSTALTLGHNSSATPAAGFGTGLVFNGKSSTTNDQQIAEIDAVWATATHASRAGRLVLSAADFTGTKREGLRVESSGAAPLLGFFGTAAAAQQTGGAATAGATYTTNEQTMLQKVYNALRTYGLLT